MSKNILLAGASGLVGNNLLNVLLKNDSNLVLISRKKINTKKEIKQIVTNFDELEQLNNKISIDTVYIAIGKRLSLMELIYLKKKNRSNFEKVDFEYIKNIAAFAKRSGAKSLGLISAVGANKNSLNTYLKVKGETEEEIMSLGFDKVIIARPGHLLGKRKNESINPIIFIFEMITNITGMLLLGPLKKFKNIDSSKVASAIIEKINTSPDGVYFLDYDDFRNY
tara:strand:- start:15 stop:686 length:672 start_codon:yes stop_codon:yes gene_type:complete